MIISCFGKRSNQFSQTREVLEVTKFVEKDEILQDDKNIAEELIEYAVSTLHINENSSITNRNFQNVDDRVDRDI